MIKNVLGAVFVFIVTAAILGGVSFLVHKVSVAEIEFIINYSQDITSSISNFFNLFVSIFVFLMLWFVVRRIFYAISRLLESLAIVISPLAGINKLVIIVLAAANTIIMIYLFWTIPVIYTFMVKVQVILYSLFVLDEAYIFIAGSTNRDLTSSAD